MKTPRARTTRKVAINVDPKLKKLWTALIGRVHAHEKKSAEDWDKEWEAAGAILEHHPPLYEFGGYKDSAEFFNKELGVDDRVGRAYVRVAEHATPQQEIAFTVWKLDAAIGYLEATHAPLAPHTPVAFERVKIEGTPLSECTVAFVKGATQRALHKKQKKQTSLYRDALSKAFSEHAAFRTLRIAESNGRVSFHGVPNASLRTFAEVVLEARLPK